MAGGLVEAEGSLRVNGSRDQMRARTTGRRVRTGDRGVARTASARRPSSRVNPRQSHHLTEGLRGQPPKQLVRRLALDEGRLRGLRHWLKE